MIAIVYIGLSALEFLLEKPYQPCQPSNRLSLLMRGALLVTHEKERTARTIRIHCFMTWPTEVVWYNVCNDCEVCDGMEASPLMCKQFPICIRLRMLQLNLSIGLQRSAVPACFLFSSFLDLIGISTHCLTACKGCTNCKSWEHSNTLNDSKRWCMA